LAKNVGTLYCLLFFGRKRKILYLTVDLVGYTVDVAVITETHIKKKHPDHHFAVNGYTLFRRDRVGRRGGGTRCTSAINCKPPSGRGRATRLSSSSCGCSFKLRSSPCLLAHYIIRPKPQYQSAALLDYIETGVDAVTAACPSATVEGDFF